MTSGHSGNPWAIDISAPSPNPGCTLLPRNFCNAPDKIPDPEYTY